MYTNVCGKTYYRTLKTLQANFVIFSMPLLIQEQTCLLFAFERYLINCYSIIRKMTRTFEIITTLIKDTDREKAPSNRTPALRKSTNMGVWAVGTLFIRGS